jgi:histidine triad (HIT) family protein
MFNHEPEGYICPFCRLVRGEEGPNNSQQDVVYRDEFVTAFIAPRWWEKNRGHVLIISNAHYENIYDLPVEYGLHIYNAARLVAIALKQAYKCDGISTRQHNEPAGNQDVWHYHVHVYPRYYHDGLYKTEARREFMLAEERSEYARRLRLYMPSQGKDISNVDN